MTVWQVLGTAGLALALAACSSKSDSPAPPVASADAAALAPATDAGTANTIANNNGGYHLDPDPTASSRRPTVTERRRRRPIELVIRSTPPGATASVDGKPLGSTPTYWDGFASGEAHEFTFALPGYAVSRYRFVPTQSGIVHGSLTRLVTAIDAGPSN